MPILVQLNAGVLLAHGQKQLGQADALALADGPCAVPAHLQGVGMQLWAAAAAAHLQKLLTFPAGFAANGWLVLALAANGLFALAFLAFAFATVVYLALRQVLTGVLTPGGRQRLIQSLAALKVVLVLGELRVEKRVWYVASALDPLSHDLDQFALMFLEQVLEDLLQVTLPTAIFHEFLLCHGLASVDICVSELIAQPPPAPATADQGKWLPFQDVKLAGDALVGHPWDKVLVVAIHARHFLQAEVLRATTRQYRYVQARVHAHINTAILAANGWPLLAAGATNG